ncbi:MAG: Nif3-like dinuclear metal center hexameric protein [Dorea sp.]
MLCRDIMELIERYYPQSYAMEWDNVGLLAGRDDKEVKIIYIAVDATDDVVDAAVLCGADMLVTHHPLIFSGMKKINNQDFIGKRLLKLIRNDISYYAMHTNYDVMGMSDLSGKKMNLGNVEVLEITGESEAGPEGIGRIAELAKEKTLREYAEFVKEAFLLEHVKVFGNLDRAVKKIAISPGSGKSMIGIALKKNADVLVTGDIGHHEGIDAVAQGLALIDAGHYGIEHIFMEDMKRYLSSVVGDAEIITAPVKHPFTVI